MCLHLKITLSGSASDIEPICLVLTSPQPLSQAQTGAQTVKPDPGANIGRPFSLPPAGEVPNGRRLPDPGDQ